MSHLKNVLRCNLLHHGRLLAVADSGRRYVGRVHLRVYSPEVRRRFLPQVPPRIWARQNA